MVKRTIVGVLLAMFFTVPAWPRQKSSDLTTVSIEDLMNIKVSSVSKTEQKVSRTAAAIYVVTQEDIRRSGATNIPDVLRMVPGVDVAQINANTWAITARGFNGRYANELLVLFDGRPVYIDSSGGVNWDTFDLPLEDIERIEVIRGPGGAIWGANAVNGVINVITKKAADTSGTMVTGGGGNLDQGFGTVQYGAKLGAKTNYRAYAKDFNQDHMPGQNGQNGGDSWNMLRAGFRGDSSLSAKDTLTVQGDLYTGQESQGEPFLASVISPAQQFIETKVNLSGGFLQGIWNHSFSAQSDTTLQISYDQSLRNNIIREDLHTWNVDFQHHFLWGNRQEVVWGLDYRHTASGSRETLAVSLGPANLNTQLFSGFIQDEITLIPDRLYITVGTKLEHDFYTGWGLMPSASVAWMLGVHHTLWASISHADRTPAQNDATLRVNFGGGPGTGGTPVLAALLGNPNIQSEELTAYETGYRATLTPQLSLDFAAYYNYYSHQETTEPAAPFLEDTPPPPHLVLPVEYENLMYGEAHGFELFADWKPLNRWTLSPGYAFEQIHMHLNPTSQDTSSVSEAQGSTPVSSAQLRSHLFFFHGLAWDVSAYYVGRLLNPEIPSYIRLDTGLSWEWREGLSFSVVGQNLLTDHHQEYIETLGSTSSSLVKRSAYAKFTWRF
jgi:iron complex outermembrane receptor protein